MNTSDVSKGVDSLTLEALKMRFFMWFCVYASFLAGSLFMQFPPTLFYLVIRIVGIPFGLFGMFVCMTGMITSRYDLVLSKEGIEFGSFQGRQRYEWSQVRATGIIRHTTGK